jgi:hypothetical protein
MISHTARTKNIFFSVSMSGLMVLASKVIGIASILKKKSDNQVPTQRCFKGTG